MIPREVRSFITISVALVDDMMLICSLGTAYLNCEVRQFKFTSNSTAEDAHVEEKAESRKTRGARETEKDANIIEEVRLVEEAI